MDWLETLRLSFHYGFMWKALVVGVAVALSSALIGSHLVLNKFSMIGHGLSHVAFAAIAIGLFTSNSPLLFAAPVVIVVSIFILKLNHATNLPGDAAIGLTASFSIALGTALASLGGGFNVDLYSYLFGSILTIRQIDVVFAIGFSLIVVGVMWYFYHDFFSMTFEEEYARVSGVKTSRLNTLLAVLTGLTIVIGIRAIGTMLISAFIIFPPVIVMQFTRSFKATMVVSGILSVLLVVSGLFFSFIFDLPSGSTIVMLSGFVFFMATVYNGIQRLRHA
ncbi:MAG: metal ABC transporter permease [Candidatus Izemoplasmataceae bacterium]